jgi:hypothetical protein
MPRSYNITNFPLILQEAQDQGTSTTSPHDSFQKQKQWHHFHPTSLLQFWLPKFPASLLLEMIDVKLPCHHS